MTNRPTFIVTMADDAGRETTGTVDIVLGDQLRAELEAPKWGLPTDPAKAPLHTTALWCWASMARQHLTELGFGDWRPHVVSIARAEPVPVDPTEAGPTG